MVAHSLEPQHFIDWSKKIWSSKPVWAKWWAPVSIWNVGLWEGLAHAGSVSMNRKWIGTLIKGLMEVCLPILPHMAYRRYHLGVTRPQTYPSLNLGFFNLQSSKWTLVVYELPNPIHICSSSSTRQDKVFRGRLSLLQDGIASKMDEGPTMEGPLPFCLCQCSVVVKRHHDHSNSYKRKHLIGLVTVSEV